MARECWVFDTTTGRPLQRVHPASGSWTTSLLGNDGTFTFSLGDPRYEMGRDDLRDLFRANARTIAVVNNGAVEYEGVNRTPRYFEASETLQVRGRSMLETFAGERMTFGVDGYANGDLPIINRSLAAAVRLILERFTFWSAQWALPIDLPANAPGGYTDDVKRWDTATISALLQKVRDQGVEVWLRPYVADGWLRYQTRVEPSIAIGSAIDINVRAPGSPATNVEIAEDGSRALTGAFAVGEGNERSTLTGWAGYMDGDDIPVRDAAIIRKKVNDVDALNGLALAELASRRNAVKQWSFNLELSRLGGRVITPGTLIDLESRGSRWTLDGRYRQRVISVRGTWGSVAVTPEVQPYGL